MLSRRRLGSANVAIASALTALLSGLSNNRDSDKLPSPAHKEKHDMLETNMERAISVSRMTFLKARTMSRRVKNCSE